MTWPPTIPPGTRGDSTEQAANHPTDHNLTSIALDLLTRRVQQGRVNSVGTGTSFAQVNVVFGEPFASPPTLVATIGDSQAGYIVTSSTTTTTGALMTVFKIDGASWTGTRPIDWIAVGEPTEGTVPPITPDLTFNSFDVWNDTNITGIGATEVSLCSGTFTPVAGQTYRVAGRVPFRFGAAGTSAILAYVRIASGAVNIARCHRYVDFLANERGVLNLGGLWTAPDATPVDLGLWASSSVSTFQTNTLAGGGDAQGFTLTPIVNSAA